MQNMTDKLNARYPNELMTAEQIIMNPKFAEEYFLKNHVLISKVQRIGFERTGTMPFTNEELTRLILSEFWHSGWKRLKSYKGNEHLDSWLFRCCYQLLYIIFKNEGTMRCSPLTFRNGQHSLRWEEMSPEVRKNIIKDISISSHREILEKCYIDMLPLNQLVKCYNSFNEMQIKKLIDEAESTLISTLIDNDSEYCIFISSKGKRFKFVDIDTVEAKIGCETEEDGIWEEILELLKNEGGTDDYVENLRIMIIKLTDKAKWSEMETTVVIKRLIYKESPVKLAEEFHVTRAYIDNFYSVRRKRLIKLFQQHWGLVS